MREILPNIYLFQERGCNVYLLATEGQLALVDSGGPKDAAPLVAQLEAGGFNLANLQILLLTHAHSDHVGAAAELARRIGVQVAAHRDEVPYITQQAALPSRSRLRAFLMGKLERLAFRTKPCAVDRELQEGDLLDVLDGLQVIHAPGHTPGSICYYQRQRHILFCGDALFNANPLTGKPGLRLPLPVATSDMEQAKESVRKLAALEVEVLLCGHGEPILANASQQMRALVAA